jgi:hypothetical protein
MMIGPISSNREGFAPWMLIPYRRGKDQVVIIMIAITKIVTPLFRLHSTSQNEPHHLLNLFKNALPVFRVSTHFLFGPSDEYPLME